MLTDHPHAGGSHLMEACKARFSSADIDLPSQRRLETWVANWKAQNIQVHTAITNPDEWKNKYMVAFGNASERVLGLNHMWEFDSTPADIMLKDGRHAIVAIIDVYSRRVMLHVSKTSQSNAVAHVTRRALLDWGVPEIAKCDNGSDYVSKHIKRIFKGLGIEQELCAPFCAWQKPHIERFFRTFSHDLVELLPGFIGHNVAERSAIESRKSFSERLFKKDQVVEVNMTSAELQTYCDDWVTNIYHQRPHSGLNDQSPFAVYSQWNEEIRTLKNDRALDILLAEAPGNGGIRTVAKSGLLLDNLHYISSDLPMVGTQVHVRYDPEDMGLIYVFDADSGEFLCTAQDPSITGISRKEVARHVKAKQSKIISEGKKQLKAAAKAVKTKDIAKEIMDKARRDTNITAFPKPSREHTTSDLEAAAIAAQALNGPQTSQQTTAQKAAHQKLIDSMNTPTPVVDILDTPEKRYAKAISLEQRLDKNTPVDPDDHAWLQRYQLGTEYRAKKRFSQGFGLVINNENN